MLRSVLRNLQLVNVFPEESWSKTADPTWQQGFLLELIFNTRKVVEYLKCRWLRSKTVYPWKDIFLLHSHLGYYLEVGHICITRCMFVNITQEHRDINFRREAIKTTLENRGVIIPMKYVMSSFKVMILQLGNVLSNVLSNESEKVSKEWVSLLAWCVTFEYICIHRFEILEIYLGCMICGALRPGRECYWDKHCNGEAQTSREY